MDSALVDKNPAPKSLTCHFCWKKNMEGHGLVAVRQLFHYVAHHPQRCLAWHRNWHECQGGRFGGPVVWKFAFEFVRSMRSVFVLFQSLKEVIQIPDLPVPCIYIYIFIHTFGTCCSQLPKKTSGYNGPLVPTNWKMRELLPSWRVSDSFCPSQKKDPQNCQFPRLGGNL